MELSTERRPRVLIVTPQPFYEDRGTPIAVRYVANALSEIGVDVDLLAFPIGQEVHIKNVKVRRCANLLHLRRVPIGFSWRKLVLDASLWKTFAGLLASRRYDMVHAVEEAAYIAAAMCPRHGQPFIYDMASAIPVELRRQSLLGSPRMQRLLTGVERRVFRAASHVLCSPGLGDYVRHQAPSAAVSEWKFPAHAVPVTAEEVQSLRAQLSIHQERRVVLYSGSFAGYQGIELLLEAFTVAHRNNPELLLVCVGATEQETASWSRKVPAEVSEHIRIIGRQPRDRMSAYIQLADFLALPRGQTDNIPLKLFDYMASGKPIIATRQAAYAPLLNEKRAFICESTAEALASAITRACISPREAESLGREALQFARRQFGWSRFVEFVRDTYGRAIYAAEEAANPGTRIATAHLRG